MNTMKLTVIGGGSVNWMRRLMRDVYLIDEIAGGEICLVDPNTEHVEAVADMLRTFNRLRHKTYDIRVCPDQAEGLIGADFVMCTFSPGAMDAFYNDLEIPVKYGIRMPVSMTCGPSGISAALRTAPVAYELVEQMEALCPGAWLLNETNPMTVVTAAMNAVARRTQVLGLCHGVHALPNILGPALGLAQPEGMNVRDYLYTWLEQQGFDYAFAGLNHFIFLVRAELNGQDMLPQIRQWSRESLAASSGPAADSMTAFASGHEAARIICDQVGYIPINHDRHTIEFWPGLCNQSNGFGMRWARKTFVHERLLHKVGQLDQIRRIAAEEEAVDWTPSGEELTMIMRSIVIKQPVKTVVIVPNSGQVANLPQEVPVETLGIIHSDRVEPLPAGELPGVVGSWSRLQADVARLTLQAALEGSRDKLIQALSLDPLSGLADFSQLPQLADELLLANRAWLPRFFDN